jgi:hypothetical protein
MPFMDWNPVVINIEAVPSSVAVLMQVTLSNLIGS